MTQSYKIFFSADKIAEDSLRLARQVHESRRLGSNSAILGIWRGGTNIASYLSGALKGYGYQIDTFSSTGKSYNEGIASQSEGIIIYNMEELMKELRGRKYETVLKVDDVFDSGRTIHAFKHIIRNGLVKNFAADIDRQKGHDIYHFPITTANDSYTLKVPLTDDIEPLPSVINLLAATPYWKPHANKSGIVPDFFVEKVAIQEGRLPWIVFPWEAAEDLTKSELQENYPYYHEILYG